MPLLALSRLKFKDHVVRQKIALHLRQILASPVSTATSFTEDATGLLHEAVPRSPLESSFAELVLDRRMYPSMPRLPSFQCKFQEIQSILNTSGATHVFTKSKKNLFSPLFCFKRDENAFFRSCPSSSCTVVVMYFVHRQQQQQQQRHQLSQTIQKYF